VLLPASLLDQLCSVPGFDRAGFLQAHQEAQAPTSIRLNPSKLPPLNDAMQPIGWSRYGYYLQQRPSFTFDPLFHAGCYYVQEASSMLLEQAFMQLMPQDQPLRVLDLCAAPGGKSTHLYSLLPPKSFLVANEVIRSRALVLRDNLIKWGAKNALVTNNDPEQFRALPNYFDWITVDAPCSGSGLFRKDPDAIGQWSVAAVQHCAARQQRILLAAWEALRPGGILFYSTCSYSVEENEAIAAWMIHELKAKSQTLHLKAEWNITPADPGYRCWPDKAKGEGFYCCCFQKQTDGSQPVLPRAQRKLRSVSKNEMNIVRPWINSEDAFYLLLHQTVYAWPSHLRGEWEACVALLHVLYSGVRIGELLPDKLVPDHALAQNNDLHHSIPSVSLSLSEAILYLQRKPFMPEQAAKGWTVATYEGFALGWINALASRINNYYPKELRIIKDSQAS
jgi:16S rRNA C967 or C1407 C5-methylase (RsmB/RsmF family)/NOL1/NOP2/fmu family ribosome biogenesis protein